MNKNPKSQRFFLIRNETYINNRKIITAYLKRDMCPKCKTKIKTKQPNPQVQQPYPCQL